MSRIIIITSIDNRTTIGKIKEFLGWNHEEYSITSAVEHESTPSRPPRRKKSSRNSVGPAEGAEVTVIASKTPMHVDDVENEKALKSNGVENHI